MWSVEFVVQDQVVQRHLLKLNCKRLKLSASTVLTMWKKNGYLLAAVGNCFTFFVRGLPEMTM